MVIDVGTCFCQLHTTHNSNFHKNFVTAAKTAWSSDRLLHSIKKSTLKTEKTLASKIKHVFVHTVYVWFFCIMYIHMCIYTYNVWVIYVYTPYFCNETLLYLLYSVLFA